uniref:Uncharacterized protein n=1 Tax=Romanomermis culicivorax TaxID=13658 RepID=A0A915JHV4_ROMCU
MANGSLDKVWIGAEYSSSSNSWTWSDYTTWSYTAWAPNQPQRLGLASCVRQVLRNGVSWETNVCSANEAVLCKIVSRDNQNGCNGSPCQNGGTCTPAMGGYICVCPSGYGGVSCEKASNTCQSQCQNGGTCTVKNNVAICVCAKGYTGATCQICTYFKISQLTKSVTLLPIAIEDVTTDGIPVEVE